MNEETDTVWDDIIVGAGAAGAVLASRLSGQPDRRVLLIEAGPDFAPSLPWPAPLLDARGPVTSGFNWDFNAHAADRADATRPAFPYPAGKVVGGGSAINGAIALRAFKEDFERWALLAGPEWGWPQVLPFFNRVEADSDFTGPGHGADGPLPICRPGPGGLHPLQAAFLETCSAAMGWPLLADLNGSSDAGVGLLPSNRRGGQRVSVAQAYLDGARARPNLRILAGTAVGRVLFAKRRAAGVELLRSADGPPRAIQGRRVTLSAGAFNTPALLQRSGVADPALCRALGIEPVADLPGVGENLIDHPSVMLWMAPKGVAPGPAWAAHHQVLARVASLPGGSPLPDIHIAALSGYPAHHVPQLRQMLGVPAVHGLSVVLCRPASRGRVFLAGPEATAAPVIEFRLGSRGEDLERLARGVRLAWRISQSPAFAALAGPPLMWSEALVRSEPALQAALARRLGCAWHAVGTARMGDASDRQAVVDAHGRVHGIDGLRIVDASVMPDIPSGPTHLACLMLAERMAGWMAREA
jgi:choline dehydrogenase